MRFRERVLTAARKRILFTRHALDQMNKPDRLISEEDVKNIVMEGEVIEEYPQDERGASCLILGWVEENRPIHVVCSPKDGYLTIVTAYRPRAEEWYPDLRVRRR